MAVCQNSEKRRFLTTYSPLAAHPTEYAEHAGIILKLRRKHRTMKPEVCKSVQCRVHGKSRMMTLVNRGDDGLCPTDCVMKGIHKSTNELKTQ